MISKLQGESKKFVQQVQHLWMILKEKKNIEKDGVRMFKDIGLLMQTRDQEVHEMLWLLVAMMDRGEIAEEGAQRVQSKDALIVLPSEKVTARVHPRARQSALPTTPKLDEASISRQKRQQSTEGEYNSGPIPKKSWAAYSGKREAQREEAIKTELQTE